MKNVKTYSAKPSEVTRNWYVIDASDAPLGRLSTVIATKLMGKDKPMYTPHIDCGDHIVVINTDKLVVTGNKLLGKKYYRHTGFPGGIKEVTLGDKIAKDSGSVIVASVRGMIPRNKLQPERLKRLHVFAGEEHEHNAQQPTKISFSAPKESK